jgi:hypothetical protein
MVWEWMVATKSACSFSSFAIVSSSRFFRSMLRSADRGNLSRAMHQHGGFMAVAQRLGLVYTGRCKPPRYWQDLAVIDRELLAFIAAHSEPGVMPKKAALTAAGRSDLENAISRAGGQYATAQRLGLHPADTRRPHNHWADFANLERELRAFLEEPGRPQGMPTLGELIAADRFDLHYAVQRHGGVRAVAERLGVQTASAQRSPKPEPGSGKSAPLSQHFPTHALYDCT